MHRTYRRPIASASRTAWTLLPILLVFNAGLMADTDIVEDILPGSFSSEPNGMVRLGGLLVFGADDGSGEEPWVSDGTIAGTRRLKDIAPGGAGSGPFEMTAFNQHVYFEAWDSNRGYELWRTDGTTAGTELVKDINPGPDWSFTDDTGFVAASGELFFGADDGNSGFELWKTTGSTASTVRVKDINRGPAGSEVCDLESFKGKLYFGANDGTNGRELWRSDGTGAGTKLFANIASGAAAGLADCDPDFTESNGLLYFGAYGDGQGRELWVTDGTAAGTRLVKDIRPGFGSSDAEFFIAFEDGILFAADDGVNGYELWRSDGTAEGTVLVKDINPGSAGSIEPNTSTSIMKTANGQIFFGATDGVHGIELWTSDGTAAGTYMLRDITPGPEDSTPRGGENSSDTLFFRASSPFGTELYRTNGTRVGTVLVEDIQPGPICSVPTSITDVWGTLFFAADDGSRGDELWRSGEPVQPLDIERLPSVNSNNKADAAVLVRDFKQGKGYNTVIVKDGVTGKTISNAQFFNPTWRAHDLVTIDRGKDSRVAVLATRNSGDIAVAQRDANDSQFRGKIDYFNRSWRALEAAAVPKVGATGISVLAVRRDGRISVQTRKMNDGALIRTTTYLDKSAHAVTLAAVPDMSGNGRSEIAVLARRAKGRPVVSIRDGVNGKLVKNINLFTTNWRPLDLAVVDSVNGNGSPDVAVLAENGSGRIAVEVRDGSTGAQLKRIVYLSAKWTPHQLRALPDSNGNGAVELAVLAANDAGNIRAEVRDARSGNRIKAVNFLSTAFAPVAMAVLDDIEQSDADELALLAFRREGGDLRVQERDGGDGTLVRNTPIP